MSALALSLLSIEEQGVGFTSQERFNQKASFLARLGSGSAARSIQGPMMSWGETTAIQGSSQEFATCIDQEIHPVFRNYQDTILIIDKGQKKVSSTLGHQLMENHPYATSRFEQAHLHMGSLMAILTNGEVEDFMQLVELEALTLHALMMASNPYFVLMQPNTLAVLNKIWAFREATKLPLCFTLDAGANIHLLYPEEHKNTIGAFIASDLAPFCEAGQYIEDQVGTGAKKL
jgi:diphosphomevalonate decarboxylase